MTATSDVGKCSSWLSAVVVLLILLTEPVRAQEPARIALLIGNQKYVRAVGELQNPHKDIGVVGAALGQIGFKDTQSRRDVSRDEMLFAVLELARKLRRAGRGAIGFLYYTGHGVSVGGENVLVPVNAQRTTDEELSVRGVRLSELLDILKREAPDAVLFIVLDACRNNIGGSRGAKGFAPVNDQRNGVVIAFATQAGATASDEGATSGPYAAALADEIVKPGLNDQAVFNAVRTRVATATRGAQVPWTHDGLVGERVVFSNGAVVPAPDTSPPMSEAAVAWDRVKDSRSIAVLDAYAKQFASTVYAALAAERITELRREGDAAKSPAEQRAQQIPMPSVQNHEQRREEVSGKIGDIAAQDSAATLAPGSKQSFRDRLADGRPCQFCPEMVVVPAGRFLMGSTTREPARNSDEGPQRNVTVARSFAVGRYEVTFDEWDACVADGGCKRPNDMGWGRGKLPVIRVSWNDIKEEFLPWLNRRTGKIYRLLTEAEWEYVARAGTTTPFWWGHAISTQQANYNGHYVYNNGDKGEVRQRTVQVDSFGANAWGLFNVHGNVWELVEDCWLRGYVGGPTDGTARLIRDCSSRVVRGGGWLNSPDLARSAARRDHPSNDRSDIVGFRLARNVTP